MICLCAAWCDICADYRDGFFALAVEFPGARDGAELFYGPLPPQHEHLGRLIRSLEIP